MTNQSLYDHTSERISKLLTHAYSTSFSSASRLFPKDMRSHIYNIYGLVRIADEIVDTYADQDAIHLLDSLEEETYNAIARHYSSNPIVHAFQISATTYGITRDLIKPFFESMRLDTTTQHFDQKLYDTYIYGSAEVVGLMCLRVFVQGDDTQYATLKKGACALGSAFQKVNFLRDLAADHSELNRWYFPYSSFDMFTEKDKQRILDDIAADFAVAQPAIDLLPVSARAAVATAYHYYYQLFQLLTQASVQRLKTERIRVPNTTKAKLLISANLKANLLRQK